MTMTVCDMIEIAKGCEGGNLFLLTPPCLRTLRMMLFTAEAPSHQRGAQRRSERDGEVTVEVTVETDSKGET